MYTLVPVGTFEAQARKLLGDDAFDGMLELLAKSPEAGAVIQGTGGLRKIRIARGSGGKSGGTRVIYYYHNESEPILLLLIYAKADRENITARQKKKLKTLVDVIGGELR